MRGDAGHASKALVMTGSSSTSGARNLRVVEHAPRVLIVEDELLVAWQLESMIRDQHLEVCGLVPDGQGAIEQAADLDVDLILMDIRLAGRMDGIELLSRIKQLDPDALVIMITAFSSVETAIAALRKGAYDYITKPFINEDILQTVRNALRQTELFRENRYLRRELKRDSDEFRDDVNFRRNEEMGKVQKVIGEAIQSLATEKEFDLVLGDGVFYASKAVDITELVIEKLKKSSK